MNFLNMNFFIIAFIFSLPLLPVAHANDCRIILPDKNNSSSIIFISDTQRPIWVESLWLRETNNIQATIKLFDSIASQNPAAVFHGGDLVAFGFSESAWSDFNKSRAPLMQQKIPLFSVRGNHEFLFFPDRAEQLFRREFAHQPCRWMTVLTKSIATILLDSNFSQMSKEETLQQNTWLAKELSSLDQDPAIAAIILLAHHPPFTNSTIVSASSAVERYFVPPFIASSKTRLMLSGHAHAFERFRQKEKEFLVIGGGGGLLQPLNIKNDAPFRDLSPYKTALRFFHYLQVKMDNGIFKYTLFKMDLDNQKINPEEAVSVYGTAIE
ncbi:MAG: hypothetical protein A2504_02265 [Bdellovibrionales bacterium RIFOXYD12_FULL_39_22]|nr:MAG: hypothetical protein A2485_01460 [Bdellovibrionales bacterium RIFOXYC12_FULL_39_17]OFZ92580.1 MAG: hypothetical protein A2504_02265 [Bdellovibrionales bacterium RIFOXYD12_FULL_39_22]